MLTHTSVKSHWFRKISRSCLKVICQPGCSVTSFSLLVSHSIRYLLGSQGPLGTSVMARQDGLLAAQETNEHSAHSAVLYHAWEHMHVPASGKGSAKSRGLVISRLIPLLALFLIHSHDFSGLQSSCQWEDYTNWRVRSSEILGYFWVQLKKKSHQSFGQVIYFFFRKTTKHRGKQKEKKKTSLFHDPTTLRWPLHINSFSPCAKLNTDMHCTHSIKAHVF